MQQYRHKESEEELALAGDLIMQVVELEVEIARKQALLNSMENETERAKVEEVLKRLEEQSAGLQLQLATTFSNANKTEYSRQQSMLRDACGK